MSLGGGLTLTGSLRVMAAEQGETPVDIKPRSRDVTDGPNRAPARELALDLIVTVLANGLLAAQALAPPAAG